MTAGPDEQFPIPERTGPDEQFPIPERTGPDSVWADRTGHRTLLGHNQRGVTVPIGKGEGEISPGELLKLALIGCAGMSSDENLARRLGDDFAMRLWAHGTADESANRYRTLAEEVQLPLEGLSEAEADRIITVFGRAVAAACTVERTVVPGVEVTHTVLRDDRPADSDGQAPSEQPPQSTTEQESTPR